MNTTPANRPARHKAQFNRGDFFIAFGFAAVSAAAHLVWNPIVEYWQFVATTLLFAGVLTFWLVMAWRNLQLFVTRFYCVAVIFDILAEGLLQPFHRCTLNNIMCTGRLFLVFFAFWLVAQPIERRLAARR